MLDINSYLEKYPYLLDLLFSFNFILIEEDNNNYSIKSIINKNKKVLIICNKLSQDTKNFLLSYKIAEYILNQKEEYISTTSIDTMDMNIYEYAKIIYNHYKDKGLKKRIIL